MWYFFSADSETMRSFRRHHTKENSASTSLVINHASQSRTQSRAGHVVWVWVCICAWVCQHVLFPDILHSRALSLAALTYQPDFLLLSCRGKWNEISHWSASCLFSSRWQLLLIIQESDQAPKHTHRALVLSHSLLCGHHHWDWHITKVPQCIPFYCNAAFYLTVF